MQHVGKQYTRRFSFKFRNMFEFTSSGSNGSDACLMELRQGCVHFSDHKFEAATPSLNPLRDTFLTELLNFFIPGSPLLPLLSRINFIKNAVHTLVQNKKILNPTSFSASVTIDR